MQTCLGCGRPFTPTTASMYCTECTNKTTVYGDNTYNIGLKEIKFCKYCGSKNIIQTSEYYKHYDCLECGTQHIE